MTDCVGGLWDELAVPMLHGVLMFASLGFYKPAPYAPLPPTPSRPIYQAGAMRGFLAPPRTEQATLAPPPTNPAVSLNQSIQDR